MSKGRNFEREISGKISLWLTNGKKDDCVWHTEGSGGRATNRRGKKTRDTMFGDLCPTDPSLQSFFNLINIELKSGYAQKTRKKSGECTVTNWSFNDIIDGAQEKNQFFKFWEQCLTDSYKSQREPILIFRRNRRNACIAMYSDLFEAFNKFSGFGFGNISLQIVTPAGEAYGPSNITICSLKDFFKWFVYSEALLRGPITKTIMKRRAK